MLSLRDIIGNIKKGQSALNVRSVLNDLEKNYQLVKNKITILGADKDGTSGSTIYLTIPSRNAKKPEAIYTVAIWCKTQTKMNLDTDIKVYTNTPSFLYNFAYVFNKKGSLLFPEKYPKEFKTIPPKLRNPYGVVGFDKTVFSSIRFISDYKIPKILAKYEGRAVPSVPSIQFRVNRSTGKSELIS